MNKKSLYLTFWLMRWFKCWFICWQIFWLIITFLPLFCSPTAWLMCWFLCWLMSCVTFCSIRFPFDFHIYLMSKNSQHFHSSQPRTGIFFNGESRPRRRPWPLTTWPPCFKYKPSPTMPSPQPLCGFKYSPWPSVSTFAMFERFFKWSPFPMALFVAFRTKADPTPDSAPVANVGRTVFAKNGRAFAVKPAKNERNPPSVFMLWTTWRLLIFIVMPFPSW